MSIKFKSFCSGSGGNAALLWNWAAGLLIDFAPGCQRDCRGALDAVRLAGTAAAAVLVTHAHGDHINANSLKVLRAAGLPLLCHPEVALQIKRKYGAGYAGMLRTFERRTEIAGFTVSQARVQHAPGYYTSAFSITAAGASRNYKASVFTDLNGFTEEHLALAADSDLLALEANHDPELLKRYGHPGSEFHLSNLQAALFLHGVCARSRRQPKAVVLGHLSEDCNAPHLPLAAIEACFGNNKSPVKFKTHVSPRSAPGAVITIK